MNELVHHLMLASLQHPELFERARLTGKQREVYYIISGSAKPTSPRDIALRMCINKEWAIRIIERLLDKGYISVVDAKDRTYRAAL